MADYPKTVTINEEGPREGFQFEKGPIATARKIELIDALSETGLKQIQVCSFVPAKNVPGMADADEVVRGFNKRPGVRYTGLWLNEKGLQRAMASKRLEIRGTVSLTTSAVFLKRNQNRTLQENLEAQRSIVAMYKQHQVPVERGSMMAVFGCNFEGDIPIARVLDLIQQALDLASEQGLTLKVFNPADTRAWATPDSIRKGVGAVR